MLLGATPPGVFALGSGLVRIPSLAVQIPEEDVRQAVRSALLCVYRRYPPLREELYGHLLREQASYVCPPCWVCPRTGNFVGNCGK